MCFGQVQCMLPTPYCDPPYVLSYADSCFEGCVVASKCQSSKCPAYLPANLSTCEQPMTCTFQDCAAYGRNEARCQSGIWNIQLGACGTECPGAGVVTTKLDCAADEICVLTTGGGGAYMVTPSCVKNTCDPAPTSLSCMNGLSGSCSVSSATVIRCSEPSLCGPGMGGCQ